jgi:hypothetical protein
MTKFKKLLVALPVTALLLGIVTVPVYAHDGEDDSGSNSGSSENNNSGSDSTKTEDSTTNSGSGGQSASGRQTEDKLRHKGQDLLKQAKELKQQKENSAASDSEDSPKTDTALKERRQKRCENRKHGLETKVANIVNIAQKHKSRIDDVYAKALAYQKDKDITVENFDALVAAADSAKAQAQASVDALTGLKPTIQCTSDTVATDVATFKAGAEQARTDLKTYRISVKAILTALKDAKES